MRCEVVAHMNKGGCTARGSWDANTYPSWFTWKLAWGDSQAREHVSNIETDLTKSAPNPRAPAHRGPWRASWIINKKNMLTAMRWRSFITHVQAHTDLHRCTHGYMYAYSIFFCSQRGVWCTCSSLLISITCIMYTQVHLRMHKHASEIAH